LLTKLNLRRRKSSLLVPLTLVSNDFDIGYG
jgi:hypothetical protein